MQQYYALFSGGLDSTQAILKVMSGKKPVRITPLFFRYGQKSEEKEHEAVQKLVPLMRNCRDNDSSILDDCKEYDLTNLFSWSKSPILKHNIGNENNPDVDVENRNMILIGCAASIIMSEWKIVGRKNRAKLIVGFKNEHYDTKLKFANSISEVFSNMDKPISIVTPLIIENQERQSSYHRLAKDAQKLGIFELLKQSWSCYYPKKGSVCKECSACKGRNAFLNELEIRIKMKDNRI